MSSMTNEPTTNASATLLEILGIDPTDMVSATIHMRRRQPLTIECEMFVRDDSGEYVICGNEAFTTDVTFTATAD